MKKRYAVIFPLLAALFLSACKPTMYKVTFNTDGGTSIDEVEIKKGQLIDKPSNPSKVGYDFINWTNDGEEWNFNENKVTSDVTLTANYTLHNYKVTFKNVDDSIILSKDNYHYGDLIIKPSDPTHPVKPGYDFTNWTFNDKVWNFDEDKIDRDVTLVANYELHKYTAIFKNIDGTELDKQENLYYGDPITYKGVTPTYPNPEIYNTYTFKGWNKELVVSGDMEFLAAYDVREKYYHVSYLDYDGTILFDLYTDSEEEANQEYPNDLPEDFVKEGIHYHFLNWHPRTGDDGAKIYDAIYDRYSVDLIFDMNTVSKYKGTYPYVVIPSYYNGFKIDTIGVECFKGCKFLTEVEIPNTINDVLFEAFRDCTSLKSIKFEGALNFIESNAFKGCTSLETVIVPNEMVGIVANAFEDCPSLKYNEYQNGLYLGNEENPYVVLFKVKDNTVTSFDINPNCSLIGAFAFSDCKDLRHLNIPNSVKLLGQSPFPTDGKLQYNNYKDCFYLGNDENPYLLLVGASVKTLMSYDVHKDCRMIDDFAFEMCTAMLEISLPEYMTFIGTDAFAYCQSLTSFTVPDGIKSLSPWTFAECKELESITLPDSLIYIEYEAFRNCKKLNNVVIPNSVIFMAEKVFNTCSSLTNVTLSTGMDKIRQETFMNCSALESITIPEGIFNIEKVAFEYCNKLTTINIPHSMRVFSANAFYKCPALATINYNGTKEEWEQVFKCDGWMPSTTQYVVNYLVPSDGNN